MLKSIEALQPFVDTLDEVLPTIGERPPAPDAGPKMGRGSDPYRRKALLSAAREGFAQRGYDGTTVAERRRHRNEQGRG
jgi:hypothetical protein